MDYNTNTDMTYVTDKDDLYYFYVANGIESVLMVANAPAISYVY